MEHKISKGDNHVLYGLLQVLLRWICEQNFF